MKSEQITYDPIYNTVEPDDFLSLIDVDRYATRTDAFDKIISQTHDHFWDPTDPRYIEFKGDYDLANDSIMPLDFAPELNTAVADRLEREP